MPESPASVQNPHRERFSRACQFMPGGVNSPVRAFAAVGMTPIFFERAAGAWLEDPEEKRYLDYVGGWGPMILGHSPPAVCEALRDQLQLGSCFGAPHELETQLAEQICAALPSMEKIRMVNSGTEAAMSAIRLARACSGREKILKFAGGYHGHADSLLVKAGSGVLQGGQPDSPGVPAELAEKTLVAEYNDLQETEQLLRHHRETVACILVEPIAGNMNLVLPQKGFLQGLRKLCDQYGVLLIFDEVMSGFRVAWGGAQTIHAIRPDISILGKIIGGGLPVGAFGGRAELMDQLAPEGPVYQAGTLSGNALTMCAGLATMRELQRADFYPRLNAYTEQLCSGLQDIAHSAGVAFSTRQIGGMFGLFPGCESAPRNYREACAIDPQHFRGFFCGMLEKGIYFAPSPFEAGFVSAAHGEDELRHTLTAAAAVFQTLSKV